MKNFPFRNIKICTLCTVLMVVLMAWAKVAGAQSLSFSQVLLISNVEDTVPVGKVWKVESFHQDDIGFASSWSPTCNNGYLNPYKINGQPYYSVGSVTTGYSSWGVSSKNDFPVWLPAGTRLMTGCSGDFLSVIEFNVVP